MIRTATLKVCLVAFFTLALGSLLKSQDFLGFANSNYVGVTGISLQPACIVDDRMEFDMTLFGGNVAAYNNYLGLKKSALKPFKGTNSKGEKEYFPTMANDTDFIHNMMEERTNNKMKSVYSSVRINMPSFMVYCNHKNSLAFTWDIRNYVNADGISPALAKLIVEQFDYPSLWTINAPSLNSKNLSVQQMAWAEYGLTYGRVLKEDNEHFFKTAVRVKFLQGIMSSYMDIKDFKFNVPNDTTLNFLHSEASYGHSRNFEFEGNNVKLKTLESYPGVGLDFGFVYEWRPDYKKYKYDMDGETGLWRRDQNKYKLRVGFSALDLGTIKFKKGNLSNDFIADFNLFNLHKFDTINSVTGFDSLLKQNFPSQSNPPSTYKMTLPTAFSLQVDYNIWKDFYVNMTPFFALQFKNRVTKIHEYSAISITPRWDHKWFGVFVPVTYHQLDGFRVGTSIRLGPLIVGTSNLTPLVSKKSVYGGDVHVILKVPVPFHKPRDKDKDGISDKKDKCKDMPGTWEFLGCPDRDGDHIPDAEDKCPDVAGIKSMNGCPDKDGDKITDAEDMCPDDSGLVEFRGCPDRDGDQIIDKDDECPDEAGIASFFGCPDRDGDGTPDKLDKCPDAPGPIDHQGCPDKDGDGVLDIDDACVDVKGEKDNKGCPWPDTDKDGIVDKDDDCPTVFGVKEFKGCPPAPVLKEAEKKILEQAFANLEFATGKDIIKKTSFKSLDDLAKLLKEHSKDWVLNLDGHTDNQGDPAKNMLLSEKRAKAVMKYLVKKGVKADKIKVEWHGSTKPIADNATKEGQQKNRRVEMKVIFK
jgi:outer membrane protein OmpA-like peptidoglycan-associated protein